MQIWKLTDIDGTDRDVTGSTGEWRSRRLLLASDDFGYSVSVTVCYGGTSVDACYANHVEAVYCIEGKTILVNRDTGAEHLIEPGTMYTLDKGDKHTFRALVDTTFFCIFTPPLTGREDHDENGVYPLLDV